MANFKFTPNIWISFYLENEFYIGRTLIHKNLEIVSSISENGKHKRIRYVEIEKPKQIKILRNIKSIDYKVINNASELNFDCKSN